MYPLTVGAEVRPADAVTHPVRIRPTPIKSSNVTFMDESVALRSNSATEFLVIRISITSNLRQFHHTPSFFTNA